MNRREILTLLAGLPATAMAQADPWTAFAGGGVAVLLRHAQTVPGIGDPPGFRLEDCSTQRNLSDEGRAQAARIGAAFRGRGVRIDELRSSRWCRCLDTARLAFPHLKVQPFDALNSFFDDRGTGPAQTAAARRYIAGLGRRNAVLVTHMVNIAALTSSPAPMGGALLVRASGDALATVGALAF